MIAESWQGWLELTREEDESEVAYVVKVYWNCDDGIKVLTVFDEHRQRHGPLCLTESELDSLTERAMAEARAALLADPDAAYELHRDLGDY